MKYKIIDEDATFRFKKVKREEDYTKWHTQICNAAGIVDGRYPVSGFRVWMPWGLKMMEIIHNKFQEMAEKQGGQRIYFPVIIPYEFAKKNESWWKKFDKEGYHVIAKSEKEEKDIGIMRPTGEPAMYPMFAMWIRSKNDLPIKVFQVCHNYRKESVTYPLLRDREFWWMEYHCAFATKEEVEKETEEHLKLILSIADFIGVPVITVIKPKWEVFPGGIMSYENYIVMPDGKTVDAGSINNLGQAYSKKFDIKFGDDYPWIVCTGYASRWLAGVLGFHGDNKGLVLPPTIAPIQVIIIPIIKKNLDTTPYANKIMKEIEKLGIRVDVDDRELSVGRKFYDWEIKGVPLRIEIGEKEMKNNTITIVERDTNNKREIKDIKEIPKILDEIQKRLKEKAKKELEKRIKEVKEINEVMKVIKDKKVAKMYWCESRECYDKIMSLGEGIDAFGTDPKKGKGGKCIVCKKNTKTILYAANTY